MNHVPHDLLLAFAEGDVDDQLAVHIADHIDGCATCLARAAALDPLADAVAEVADPELPPSLIDEILAAAARAPIEARATSSAAPGVESLPTEAAPLATGHPVLAEETATGVPWIEVAIGLAMLLVAAALSLAGDPTAQAIASDPTEVLARLGTTLGLVQSVGHTVRVGLGAGPLGLGMAAAMALFGLFITARVALEGAADGREEGAT